MLLGQDTSSPTRSRSVQCGQQTQSFTNGTLICKSTADKSHSLCRAHPNRNPEPEASDQKNISNEFTKYNENCTSLKTDMSTEVNFLGNICISKY